MSLQRVLSVPVLVLMWVLMLVLMHFQQVQAQALTPQTLQPGAMKSCPQVSYPAEAERSGASGRTRVTIFIDAQGQVTEAEVSASAGASPEHKLLDALAVAAAKACQFQPFEGVARGSVTMEWRWRNHDSFPVMVPGPADLPFHERLENLRQDWLRQSKERLDNSATGPSWAVVEHARLGIALYRGPPGWHAVLAITRPLTGMVKGVRVGDPWNRVNPSLGPVRPAWAPHAVPPSLRQRLSDVPMALARLTVQVEPHVEATFVSDDNAAVTAIYLVSTVPVITTIPVSPPPAPIRGPQPAGRAPAPPEPL